MGSKDQDIVLIRRKIVFIEARIRFNSNWPEQICAIPRTIIVGYMRRQDHLLIILKTQKEGDASAIGSIPLTLNYEKNGEDPNLLFWF